MSERKPLRDGDLASQVQNLHALGWSLFGGTLAGFAGAALYGAVGFVLGWILGAALIFVLTVVLAGRAAAIGGNLYMSSGSSTPARREYSLAATLAAQGKYAAAVAEYERCAAAYPDDPEPRLRLARLQRDQLGEPEAAARWFKEALAISTLDFGMEALTTRELTELLVRRMAAPERALPVLARFAERHRGTPQADWARAEIAEIKQKAQETR